MLSYEFIITIQIKQKVLFENSKFAAFKTNITQLLLRNKNGVLYRFRFYQVWNAKHAINVSYFTFDKKGKVRYKSVNLKITMIHKYINDMICIFNTAAITF